MNKFRNKVNKRNIIILILIITLIIVDQITKILAVNLLKEDKVIIKSILEFSYTINKGIALGIASNNILTVLISNIIVIGLIIRFMIIQNERINNITFIVLASIIAGGISNLCDRIFRGFVIDFIKIFPQINFPVINIADILIFVGWIMLAFIFALNTYKEFRKRGK